MADHERPLTPLNTVLPNTVMAAHDSPYSDYYTDDARSDYKPASSASTRVLLRQLNTFAAQILNADLTDDEGERLKKDLDRLQARFLDHTAASGDDLKDSGLGLDCDHAHSEAPSPVLTAFSHDASNDHWPDQYSQHDERNIPMSRSHVRSLSERSLQQDSMLNDAQSILQRVTRANIELQARFTELRNLNDQLADELEFTQRQVLELRSERDELKTDVVHDHSELLFLDLQMKDIELHAQQIIKDQPRDDDLNARTRADIMRDQRLNEKVNAWNRDWTDVNVRMRERREMHGVKPVSMRLSELSEPTQRSQRDDAEQHADDEACLEEQVWQLDMCKRRHGRVESILISRRCVFPNDPDDTDSLTEDASTDDIVGDVEEHQAEHDHTLDTDGVEVENDGHNPLADGTSMATLCASCRQAAIRDPNKQASSPTAHTIAAWDELRSGLMAFAGMTT